MTGLTCAAQSEWYSECARDPYGGPCSENWHQCGGRGWAGPTCCAPGLQCDAFNDYYSQCRRPEVAAVMAHDARHAGPEPEGRPGGAAVMAEAGGHRGGLVAKGRALRPGRPAKAAVLLADRAGGSRHGVIEAGQQ